MLRGISSWFSSTCTDRADRWKTHPSSNYSENMDKALRTAQTEARRDSGGEDAAAYPEDSDWDEYSDEIACAVAFASWQEASANAWDWDEDDAEVAAERGEMQGFGENWEDWAAVDELEDDATCHRDMGIDEEY